MWDLRERGLENEAMAPPSTGFVHWINPKRKERNIYWTPALALAHSKCLGNKISKCSHQTYAVAETRIHEQLNKKVLEGRTQMQCEKYRDSSCWENISLAFEEWLAFGCLSCFSLPLSLGLQISSFTQADLTSRNVQYVHSSEAEKHSDAFIFVLSDGVSEVGEDLGSILEWILIPSCLLCMDWAERLVIQKHHFPLLSAKK
jgi:hypothetical protein